MLDEQEKIKRTGYLSQEFIDKREGDWTDRDGQTVWLGCSDEGKPTDASIADLEQHNPDVMSPREGFLSVYGQVPGLAKNALAVGIATQGEEFIKRVDGLEGLIDKLTRFMKDDDSPLSVQPALHSDRTKEAAAGDTAVSETTLFCAHGQAATGCAYCGGVGAVAHLVGTNARVQEVGKADIAYVTGRDDGITVDALIAAQAKVAQSIGPDFAFSREEYVASSLPVMVLQRAGEGDKHIAASKTGAIINLNPYEVRNAHKACDADEDFYGLDIAGAALAIRRALKEYELPADLLMKSLILDAAAVRAVLASHDTEGDITADPRRIGLGVRGGTYQNALEQIKRLEHAA